jgi:hypothetical protein
MDKVTRKTSKAKYIVAAFITLLIFLLGLFMGFVIEGKRTSLIENQANEQKVEFASLQLQYSYMDQLALEGNCEAVIKTFEQSINTLESSRIRLENFDQNAQINKQEFELLRRDYMLSQIRYWLLAKREREICKNDLVTVFYFYSTKEECPDCEQQAFILTYLKKLFGDKLLVFSFDGRFEKEPMIVVFKEIYNISTFPTVVVEDKTYSGVTEKEIILEEVCHQFKTQVKGCEAYVNITSPIDFSNTTNLSYQ